MKNVFRSWFLGITTIFALLAFGAATYAWFTSNRAVSTSTAHSKDRRGDTGASAKQPGRKQLPKRGDRCHHPGEPDYSHPADAGFHRESL